MNVPLMAVISAWNFFLPIFKVIAISINNNFCPNYVLAVIFKSMAVLY